MKSNASVYLEVLQVVYGDACSKCPADVFDLRDLKTIRSRVEHRGLSELTITLPDFCKDLERSLAEGRISPTFFRSFKKNGAMPAFLQGMLGKLFDRKTGEILDEKDSPAYVEAIRQICLVFKKVELPCSPERRSAAVENFIAVEQINEVFDPDADMLSEFASVSDVLWADMLGDIQPDMLVPRHGPGATAEGISGNKKYRWQYWYERLEDYFPILGWGYPVSAALESDFENVTFVPTDGEKPVKVTLVPKTLKSPRVIAIEPVCMQYAQQAIRGVLYDRCETDELTAGHVNFRDQSVNQRLALTSSKTGRFATIDLSDASDRVPHGLAMYMFASNPWLRGAVDACRSTSARLPDGRVIAPLHKFASMGSALCFPVESMYFYTIALAALLRRHDLSATRENLWRVSREVYVYGDDMVVPADDAGMVLSYLQRYNCKVNASKSFWTGKFRESCGVDAYDGKDVTPVYVRQECPQNRRQASQIVSWVATANLFYLKGYWKTAAYMFKACERVVGSLPYVSPTSSALGRVTFLGYRSAERWNENYQSLELRGLVPVTADRSDRVSGYSALMKCLLQLEARKPSIAADASLWDRLTAQSKGEFQEPLSKDWSHLERSLLRGAVTLKRRWVPVT